MALTLVALYALQQGFSARHAHSNIYLSFKYADPLAIRMCVVLICSTTMV